MAKTLTVRLDTLYRNRLAGEFHNAMADQHGLIRGASTYDKSAQALYYYYRDNKSSPWVRLNIDSFDDSLVSFAPEIGKIYVSHRMPDEPAASLYLYDTATQQ